MVAIRYAARFPEQVRSLVLVGAQVRAPRGAMAVQSALMRALPGRLFGARPDAKPRMLAVLRGRRKPISRHTCRR